MHLNLSSYSKMNEKKIFGQIKHVVRFHCVIWLNCLASSKMAMKKQWRFLIFSDIECTGIRWDSLNCIVGKIFQSTWSIRQSLGFRFHVNILTWSCYIFQSLWQPSCTPFKAAWLLESPFLWLFASEYHSLTHLFFKSACITYLIYG